MLAGCPAETVAFRCPVKAPFPLVFLKLGHARILSHAAVRAAGSRLVLGDHSGLQTSAGNTYVGSPPTAPSYTRTALRATLLPTQTATANPSSCRCRVERMFHIIGVSHRAHTIQKGGTETTEHKEFRACLESAIAEYHPAMVGEELSEYALKHLSELRGMPQESLTKAIAGLAGVSHRFCDPDDKARAKMGYVEGWSLAQEMIMKGSFPDQEAIIRGSAIETAKHWPNRERFWLDLLSDVMTKEVIFVCGDAHVERFQELLKKNEIDSDVPGRHFGVTERDDQRWAEVKAYLTKHPELST